MTILAARRLVCPFLTSTATMPCRHFTAAPSGVGGFSTAPGGSFVPAGPDSPPGITGGDFFHNALLLLSACAA